MNVEESYIKELITEYFLNNLDDEGKRGLLLWIKKDKEHEFFFKRYIRELYVLQITGAWNSIYTNKARERVLKKLHRLRNLWTVGIAAAVVVTFVSIVFFSLHHLPVASVVEKKVFSELTKQRDKYQAVLSIGENKKVILDGTEKKVVYADSNSRVIVNADCEVHYENKELAEDQGVEMHSLEVPRGSEFKVVLGDGTRVWMNALTKLVYPESFRGEKREVFLTGEAYFEVASNVEVPFIVKTADMEITVLGTSFNVKAYPEDENVVTTLVSGKVSQEYTKSEEEVILNPSDQAVYTKSSGELKVERVDVNEVICWKNGRMILKNRSLKEIFCELARWYDFEVEYRKKGVEETRFYVNMDRYDDIETVLDKLQKTNGVKFMFYGRKIVVYDNSMVK
ncbi:MAG: FecR family protein [Butyricimonas virosa]